MIKLKNKLQILEYKLKFKQDKLEKLNITQGDFKTFNFSEKQELISEIYKISSQIKKMKNGN